MTLDIVVIDTRSLIKNSKSTLERHNLYAEKLEKLSGGAYTLSVLFFGSKNPGSIEINGKLKFIKLSYNPIKALIGIINLKEKSIINPKVLIAGDPWESFIVARIVKRLIFPKSKIQVQVHGDIGNPSWIHATIKNYIRSLLTALTIKKADQLRIITENQGALLISRFGVERNSFRIIPVPVNKSSHVGNIENIGPRPCSLGFVGRIQKDRGLESFLKLTKELCALDPNLSVVVAGGGPDSKSFEFQLRKFLPEEKIRYLGEVEGAKMSNVWSQIGVLASLAPTESYGRAIREALANGVPVWATPSSGVDELLKSLKDGSLRIIDTNSTVGQRHREFLELLQTKVNPAFGQNLEETDEKSIDLLIQSWLELAQN